MTTSISVAFHRFHNELNLAELQVLFLCPFKKLVHILSFLEILLLFAKSVWITAKKKYNMSSEDSDNNSRDMFGPSSDSEQMYV